jgi:pimeloyl-ACP methyl ester carboxylesterase
VAPDQRGYNLSAKPHGIDAYEVERLIEDVVALIGHLDAERAILVGHDWGGGPAWYVAMQHPELVDRLVILDSPHPERFASHIYRFPQVLKSWYMFAMRIPLVPELLFRMFRHWLPRLILTKGTLREDAYSSGDLARYQAAWSQPSVWNRTINWYRALVRRGPKGVAHLVKRTEVPCLILWGVKDEPLSHEMAEPDAELVPNHRVQKLPHAGHFPHADDPATVHGAILDFIRPS